MPINILNAPLYRALKEYYSKAVYPFHMPGHKLGRGLPDEFTRELCSLDITEIPGMDNLHQAAGIIKEAQDLAAEAFGSERTFFLVNGSTCGIYAMISSMCKPGDTLIVARDCHKSVINGMLLAGVKPLFLLPEYEKSFGITTAVTAESIRNALSENREAAGVLLTRPNYYGICCDVEEIASIVHAYNKILAVDEAHGAHFRFSARLPVSAMDAGADICVQSAHKTLPAFTQGAYLHVKPGRIDMERLEYYLSVYQTSSPSYILMASLDVARSIMREKGDILLGRLVESIEEGKAAFSRKETMTFIDGSTIAKYKSDPTRIVVNVQGTGLTGFEAEKELRLNHSVQVEMSDLYNVVCIATMADAPDAIKKLFLSFEKIADMHGSCEGAVAKKMEHFAYENKQALDYMEIMHSRSEWVALDSAAGRVSKGIVAPYPPGIPVVCPGEVISGETVGYIKSILQAGGMINGMRDNREMNVIA